MTDDIKALNNIRTLRSQARETDLATLEEMLEKLTANCRRQTSRRIAGTATEC